MHKLASHMSEVVNRNIPQAWANAQKVKAATWAALQWLGQEKRRLKQGHWFEPATFLEIITKINGSIHCGHKISNGAKIKCSRRCKTRHVVVKPW